MTRTRRGSGVAALAAAVLILAACGTRLDHETIVQAGGGNATKDEVEEFASGDDGLTGEPSADGSVAGSPSDEGGQQGETAAEGVPDGSADGSNGGATNGAAAPSGAGGRASTKTGGAPIVIGTVGTYSGAAGSGFRQGPRGLQVWAAAVNAKGGINGHRVQVVVYDDGGDGAKARSQVQELFEQRKAVALVGSFSPTTVPAWQSYVEEKGFSVIGGSCTLGWNESPAIFPQCAAMPTQAFAILKVGADMDVGKKFGGLFCTEGAECTYLEDLYFNKGMAQQAGLEPTYRARISITQPDFTSECIQARNAGVNLMFVAADPNTLTRVAASCRRQSFNPRFVSAGFLVDAHTPEKPGLSNMAIMMPTFPFAGLSTPAFNEFASAWKQFGGGEAAGPMVSYAWAAAKLFEKAAQAAGDDITTTAGIRKGLYTIQKERLGGLTAPLTFAPGQPAPDAGCWFTMVAENGKWAAPLGDRLVCK